MLKRGILLIVFSIILISFSQAYEIFYYHTDNLGSPSLMTDENASVVWSADYKPFGEAINEQGDNSYKYNSKELDDTGLLYYGARYYDAELGRFMTADTIKGDILNPQTLNRYVYTLNNPLKYVDPSGKEPIVAVYFGNREQQDIFLNQFKNYKTYSSSWRDYKISGANVDSSATLNTKKLEKHLSDAKYIMVGGHHYLDNDIIFHGEHSENANFLEYLVDAAVSLDFKDKTYEKAKAAFLLGCNTLHPESPLFSNILEAFPNAALLGYASKSAKNINADITKRFFEYANEFGGIENLNSKEIAMLWAYSGHEVYKEKGSSSAVVVGLYKGEDGWKFFSSNQPKLMEEIKNLIQKRRNQLNE